ncbi:hypothetical protein CVT24_003152 [Panaeolus cyanescens]|uniref:Uncharacterized protein n=1 Tax=Panaeolus cyanescens TaxID=181874 RepID=A0A409VNJ1_9AGAR|nr:hypothetical protein CVT24_003152 [Panaeolus cyanescens]
MNSLPRELILEIALLVGLDDGSLDATHFAHSSKRLYEILNPEIHIRRKLRFIQLVNLPSPFHVTLCTENFADIYGVHFEPLDDSVELESWFESLSMTVGLGNISDQDVQAVLTFLVRCKGLGYIDLTISRLDTTSCTRDLSQPCKGRTCGFKAAKAIIQACTEVKDVELSIKLGQAVEKDEEQGPFEFHPTPIIPILAVIPATPLTSPKSPKRLSLQVQSLLDPSIMTHVPMKRPLSTPNPPSPSLQEAPANGYRSFTLYQHPDVRVRTTSTMSQMPLEAAIRAKYRHAPYPRHCCPALKCFSLTNPRFFQASIYDLTLDVLTSSTLTCLTLDQMPFNLLLWSQIFAAITLPSLLELHLGKVEVAWPDLEAFFQRHESIKILDLRGNILVGRAALPASKDSTTNADVVKPLFPRVEVLRASTEYLAPFLQDPFHLPFLRQLEIWPTASSYPGDPYSLKVYDAVASRNQADSFYFSVIKVINLGYIRDSNFLEWAFQPYLNKPKAKGEGKRSLPVLKGVENVVYCGPPTFTKEVVDAVCAWLMDDGITPARTLSTHSRQELIIRLLGRVCPQLTTGDSNGRVAES